MIRALPKRRAPIKLDISLAIVNIVLLMILFFLATGQLLHPRTGDVAVATTQDVPIEALPSPILIVAPDGRLELDGTPVAEDLLPIALSSLPQPVTLHLLMNADAPATDLVALMNTPGLADVELRLVTLRKTDPAE